MAVLAGIVVLLLASGLFLQARPSVEWSRPASGAASVHTGGCWGALVLEQDNLLIGCRVALDVCGALIVLLLVHSTWSHYARSINRSAAVEFATGERRSMFDLSEFTQSRRGSYFWPPVVMALAILGALAAGVVTALAAAHLLSAAAVVVGLFISLYVYVVAKQKARCLRAGVLAGIPCGALTVLCAWLLWGVHSVWLCRAGAVVAWPVVFVVAIVAALLALLLFFGRGVMTSAVSFEGSDAVDAVTRTADYLLRRPLQVVGYWLFAVVCCVPGALLLAGLVVWGIGSSFADGSEGLIALAGRVLFVILWGLVAGWCVSFVQCARAISYALLRQSVDQSGPSEVFLESGVAAPASPEQSQPKQ